MLHECNRSAFLMVAMTWLLTACQVPTGPYEPLPFDTTPRITRVIVEAQAPAVKPAPVNVLGNYFLDGISLTVLAPDATLMHFQGEAIRELTGSSFEVELPLTSPGVYYLSVQSPQGLTSQTYELPVGPMEP